MSERENRLIANTVRHLRLWPQSQVSLSMNCRESRSAVERLERMGYPTWEGWDSYFVVSPRRYTVPPSS